MDTHLRVLITKINKVLFLKFGKVAGDEKEGLVKGAVATSHLGKKVDKDEIVPGVHGLETAVNREFGRGLCDLRNEIETMTHHLKVTFIFIDVTKEGQVKGDQKKKEDSGPKKKLQEIRQRKGLHKHTLIQRWAHPSVL